MIDILKPPVAINLGFVGENKFRTFQFDVSTWISKYPSGIVSVVFERPDGLTYIVANGIKESPAEWTPAAADLAVAGYGQVEVRITGDDLAGKSATIRTYVSDSLESVGAPPDPQRQAGYRKLYWQKKKRKRRPASCLDTPGL